MATLNPFDLLGDDDAEDPAHLLAAQIKAAAPPPSSASKKGQAQPPAKGTAKLPSKPQPPAQAVRESRNENQRGGRGGVRGRGGRGFNREFGNNENRFDNGNGFSVARPSEDGEVGKAPSERRPYAGLRGSGGYRGGRRGGYSNGDAAEGERPRRVYDRHSGTGRGNEVKREGTGRGNWGTPTDEIVPETEEPAVVEKIVDSEKEAGQDDAGDANKDSSPTEEQNEPEPEDKEMTLEEYEKIMEEKRKALLQLKSEERKVNLDKDLESMQLLSNKKNDDEVFIKLGSEKDKRKEAGEKAKKSLSINEFLKPAEGENNYRGGGRGRGRGRGGGRGGYGGSNYNAQAPAIEDVGQFPSLGGK